MKDTLPEKIKYDCSICAVVFGVDESILNIELTDGYRFVKKSIMSKENGLMDFFDKDFSSIQREFYPALIGFNSVICIVKNEQLKFERSQIDKISNDYYKQEFDSVEDQLETIRLLNEGYIRIRQFSAKMEPELIEGVIWQPPKINPNGTVNVPTNNFSNLHINKTQINATNEMLKEKLLSKLENEIYTAHRFYDVSYAMEPAIAVTLLSTALEVLFLTKKDKNNKKTMMAKRCASYIENTKHDINRVYLCLKDTYEKRSDFVHEGNALFVTETQVVFLRECVRKSILKALDSTETKTERIIRLKEFVDSNQQLFGENSV